MWARLLMIVLLAFRWTALCQSDSPRCSEEGCADTFEECGGSGFAPFFKPCCQVDDQCVYKNKFYSQCRPKDRRVPKNWSQAEVITCGECNNLPDDILREGEDFGGNCAVDFQCCPGEVCVGRECQPQCGLIGDECSETTECCASTECTDGTCQPGELGVGGMQCLANADCESDDCTLGICAESPCTQQNDPCEPDVTTCCRNRVCRKVNDENICALGSSLGVGSECEEGECADLRTCQIEDGETRGVCVATALFFGAQCDPEEDICSKDLKCDTDSKTCVPAFAQNGERCDGTEDCALGLTCSDGECTFEEDECGETLIEQSFDSYDGRPRVYKEDEWREDFPFIFIEEGDVEWSSGDVTDPGRVFSKGYGRAYVGDGVIRYAHPQGALRDEESGFNFDVRVDLEPGGRADRVLAATVSYWFRFSEGYDWTDGGKMPGMCSDCVPP